MPSLSRSRNSNKKSSKINSNPSSSFGKNDSNKNVNKNTKQQPPPPIPTPTPTPTPIPTPASTQPVGTNSTGGGFFSSITQGFGFGIGSSMAHRVVGSILGSNNNSPTTNSSQNNQISESNESVQYYTKQNTTEIISSNYISKPECNKLQEDYFNCINNVSSHDNCKFTLNIFKECEQTKY
jgi:hypothetical protein